MTEFAALHRRNCRAYVLDGSTRAALLADVAKLAPDERSAEPRQLRIPNVRGALFLIMDFITLSFNHGVEKRALSICGGCYPDARIRTY